MTGHDISYIQFLLTRRDVITGPVLELGAGYDGMTCAQLIADEGLSYESTDVQPGPRVTYVADFETGDGLDAIRARGRFGTVLVLNVLEHTFNPIQVADNALSLLRDEGALVCITPAIWPLHNFPIDCQRLLPDWYRRYAESRSLELDPDLFHYVDLGPVHSYLDTGGNERLPQPDERQRMRRLWSRGIHKIFNTYGRGMTSMSHVAIGCVLRLSHGA